MNCVAYQLKQHVFGLALTVGLAAVLVFLMSSPEPLLIEKLMMKITTKADRIPSA